MALQGASKVGESFQPGQEPELAPGVRGILFDEPDEIIVPVVYAEDEGSGAVGVWLDSLLTDRTVTFATVLSGRLKGMLHRRGFRPETLEDSEGTPYEVLRWRPGVHAWEELATDHGGGTLSWCRGCGGLKRVAGPTRREQYRTVKSSAWQRDEPGCSR
jgi:hypothetical protein